MNLRDLWEKIPVQFRTLINVCLGAAFAALVTYGVGVVSGGTFSISELGTAVLTAVGAVIVRMVNPGDSYGGLVVAPTTPDGAHVITDVPAPSDPTGSVATPTPLVTDTTQGADSGATPPPVA